MLHDAINLDSIVEPYLDRLATRRVIIERGLVPRVGVLLAELLPAGTWLVVADATTLEVAGRAVEKSLLDAGVKTELVLVEPASGEAAPVADDAKVDRMLARLRSGETQFAAAVAVGSGTVNDIVKLAAHKAGIPYAVVATAPSMNGYTSAIAAILSGGVKTTQNCAPAAACLADMDVLAQAPYRMIASGLGDLVSKPVANADWHLSHRLLGSEHSPDAVVLQTAATELAEGVAPRLPDRDVNAVGRLFGALCLSGFAMSVAGSSSPASGAEHLISHYLDMTHFAFGQPHDLHGCQVGVGTITTAGLHEKLAGLDPDSIDVDTRVAAHVPWEAYEKVVRKRFGPIADTVLRYAQPMYPTAAELAERLTKLKSDWRSILQDVRHTLRPAREIQAELASAGCPVTFADIDVTPERARSAILFSKDIRTRYTILHLASELGLLESWGDAVLTELHGVRANELTGE